LSTIRLEAAAVELSQAQVELEGGTEMMVLARMPKEVGMLYLQRWYLSHQQQQCHPGLHLVKSGMSRVRRFTCIFFFILKTKPRLWYLNSEGLVMEWLPGKLFARGMTTRASLVGLFFRGS
jgi:hypothetical protein